MFLFNKKIHEVINDYSFVLLAFTLPLSTKLNSFFLGVLFVNWLLQGAFKSAFEKLLNNKLLLLLVIIYLSYVLGLLYAENFHDANKILTKRASLLILPIVIGSNPITKKTLLQIIAAFLLAVLILASYSLSRLFYDFWSVDSSFQNFKLEYISRDLIWEYSALHPTYFSIYTLFSIPLLIFWLTQVKKTKLKIGAVGLACLFLLGFSLLLTARMPLIAFILISGIFLTCYLVLNRRFVLFALMVTIIGAGILYLFSNPLFNKRFVEIKETEWKPPVGIYHNSTNLRVGIFSCSLEAVKEYWLWGIGTGDVQDYLNACYKNNNYSDVMYLNRYNTHNLYLDTLIMIGIFGLLLLLVYFSYSGICALRTNNYIYLFFLLFFCVCGLSEALFNTQKGIVFFSLFNCVLLYSTIKNEKLNKLSI